MNTATCWGKVGKLPGDVMVNVVDAKIVPPGVLIPATFIKATEKVTEPAERGQNWTANRLIAIFG